jgi:hypothetical protein
MEERRTSTRHSLKPALACRLTTTGSPWPLSAVAVDISPRGIGLYLSRRPGPTETVSLELLDAPAALRREMPLRIAYLRDASDGGHLLGGEILSPLSAGEWDSLRSGN